MKLKEYGSIDATRIDNELARAVTARVALGRADGTPNFCMRVFEIDAGGYTPLHSHDWEHEIFVHSGEGEIFCDGAWHPFRSGMTVLVEPGEEHQIRNSGGDVLTFVCLVPGTAPEL